MRGRVFGEVAGEYDRIRAGYPAALVDDVLDYARLDSRPALEVGAGTGKATTAFAARRIAVTAVEPDPAMAAVLADRVAGTPGGVTVSVCPFEEYAPDRPYGLLFSAQAWHWVDPAVRWERAAAALVPGGALALFWNVDHLSDPDVHAAIVSAHREHAPHIEVRGGPVDRSAPEATWPRSELVTRPEFGELSERSYARSVTLSTVDYLALLATQSAYRILDEPVRDRLFATIADRLGDRELRFVLETTLYLARRLPEANR